MLALQILLAHADLALRPRGTMGKLAISFAGMHVLGLRGILPGGASLEMFDA